MAEAHSFHATHPPKAGSKLRKSLGLCSGAIHLPAPLPWTPSPQMGHPDPCATSAFSDPNRQTCAQCKIMAHRAFRYYRRARPHRLSSRHDPQTKTNSSRLQTAEPPPAADHHCLQTATAAHVLRGTTHALCGNPHPHPPGASSETMGQRLVGPHLCNPSHSGGGQK